MPGLLEGCGGCCLSIVLIPLLCCGLAVGALIYIDQNAPAPPVTRNFTPSASDAQAFEDEINRATNQAASARWFYITVYERQLSSWMALEGKAFADENGHAFPFEDVQVGLDGGLITFYGKLSRYGVDVPITVAVKPQIDAEGNVTLDIDAANIDGLSVPNFVLNNVAAQLDDALVRPFRELNGTAVFYGDTLSIQNGQLSLQGGVR